MTTSRTITSVADAAEDDSVVAGYRVIRLLGTGDDARVLLAVDDSAPVDRRETVALKVLRRAPDDARVAAELSALDAVVDPHVVRLLDLEVAEGRPVCLVLERLDGGSLAALLRSRRGLDPGEAVTILLGVSRGLEALHQAGWEHTRPTAARVLFDRAGRPVLTGLGEVRALAAGETPSADRERMAQLCAQVLSSVHHDLRPTEEALRGIEETAAERPLDLEDALFGLAPPAPVLLACAGPPPGDQTSGVPDAHPGSGLLDVLRRAPTGSPPRPGPIEGGAASNPRRVHRNAMRALLEARIDDSPVAVVAEAVRPWLRRRRRPIVVAAASAAALAAIALVLVPPAPGDGTEASSATGSSASGSSASPRTESHGRSGDAAALPHPGQTDDAAADGPTTAASPRTGTRIRGADPAADRAILAGDDPVAAAVLLLNLRHRCLADRSDPCLLAVDDPGSDLAVADLAALRRTAESGSARDGGSWDASAASDVAGLVDGVVLASDASLVDRTGGAALIAVAAAREPEPASAPPSTPPSTDSTAVARPPGSALVLRGPDGWRLRDVYAR